MMSVSVIPRSALSGRRRDRRERLRFVQAGVVRVQHLVGISVMLAAC
jgi:hypothetical protein